MCYPTKAQGYDFKNLDQLLPEDTALVQGELKNRVRYYIRSNPNAKEKGIQIRFLLKSGTLEEQDTQKGLSALLAQMIANNAPAYFRYQQVDFEYTLFDYILEDTIQKNLQTTLEGVRKNLREVDFSAKNIERSREMMLKQQKEGIQNFYQRCFYHEAPHLAHLSSEIADISTAQPTHLQAFYQQTYRPEQMAIVIVGSFGTAQIKSIEDLLVQYFEVDFINNNNSNVIFSKYELPSHTPAFYTQSKQTNNDFTLLFKYKELPLYTLRDLKKHLHLQIIGEAMQTRFQQLTQIEADFISYVSILSQYELVSGKDGMLLVAQLSEQNPEKGTQMLLEWVENFKRYGLLNSEIITATTRLKLSYSDISHGQWLQKISANFIKKYPCLDPTFEYQFKRIYLDNWQREELNSLLYQCLQNSDKVMIVNSMQEFSPEALKAQYQNSLAKDLAPYRNPLERQSLIEIAPKAGTIVQENYNPDTEAIELLLSNGAKVILKPMPNDYQPMQMRVFSMGGTSLYSDKDYLNALFAGYLLDASVGNFSEYELRNFLTDREVKLSTSLRELDEGFAGSCAPKEIEVLLQWLHLKFTQPRLDSNFYQYFIQKTLETHQKLAQNTASIFQQTLNQLLLQNHSRSQFIFTEAQIKSINPQRAMQIYKERFADANHFTFLFIGNFNPDSLKPLLQTYIASLPTSQRKETYQDLKMQYAKGEIRRDLKAKNLERSFASLYISQNWNYSPQEEYWVETVAEVVNLKMKQLFTQKGINVYPFNFQPVAAKIPTPSIAFHLQMGASPTEIASYLALFYQTLEEIKKTGITDEEMNQIRNKQLQNINEGLNNSAYYYSQILMPYYYFGKTQTLLPKEKRQLIEKLEKTTLQTALQRYLNVENIVQLVIYPE